MKKILSVIVLVITFSLLFVGCSEKDNIDIINNSDLRNYYDFIIEFKELVSELPEYEIIELDESIINNDSICYVFNIKDKIFDDTYRLSVYTNKDSKIDSLIFSTKRKSYGNLQFALFSFYTYKAMGFPDIDADSFYDKYNLFSEENIFESDICGDYEITSMTIETTNEITLHINTIDRE